MVQIDILWEASHRSGVRAGLVIGPVSGLLGVILSPWPPNWGRLAMIIILSGLTAYGFASAMTWVAYGNIKAWMKENILPPSPVQSPLHEGPPAPSQDMSEWGPPVREQEPPQKPMHQAVRYLHSLRIGGGRIRIGSRVVPLNGVNMEWLSAIALAKYKGDLETISARQLNDLGISRNDGSAGIVMDWLIKNELVEQQQNRAGEWLTDADLVFLKPRPQTPPPRPGVSV